MDVISYKALVDSLNKKLNGMKIDTNGKSMIFIPSFIFWRMESAAALGARLRCRR